MLRSAMAGQRTGAGAKLAAFLGSIVRTAGRVTRVLETGPRARAGDGPARIAAPYRWGRGPTPTNPRIRA